MCAQRFVTAVTCGILLTCAFAAEARWSVLERGNTNAPVISVHTDCAAPGYPGDPLVLLLAVWADGRIVWSTKTNQQTTYYVGNIAPSTIQRVVRDCHKRAGRGGEKLSRIFMVPPDCPFISVNISSEGGWIAHDMYDCLEGLVRDAREYEEKNRPQIEAWNFVVKHVMSLVPKSGQKLDSFKFKVQYMPEK